MAESIYVGGTNPEADGYVASGDRRHEPVEILFSDGLHTVPGPLVAHLGGADLLRANAARLKDHTYQDFVSGFWLLVKKDILNQAQASFIENHFAMRNMI